MPAPKNDPVGPAFPTTLKPLPNQLSLPFDLFEAARQAALFDDGRDLPGAGERSQRIMWDLPTDH